MKFELRVSSNRFPQMPAAMKRAVGKGFATAAPNVLAESQRRTPVDTGALRGSEAVATDDKSLTLSAGAGLPDARAIFVHQGTRFQGGRPYLRDAIEAGTPAIVDAIVDAAGSELR